MMYKMAVVAAIVLLSVLGPAYCSTYFVATSGDDSTGDGSIDYPFKTIPKAVGLVVPGDTIYIRGGTHTYTTTISISKSGTSGARYYLLAYLDERPALDFSSMSESSSNRGINLTGSYWYIKGIDIKGAGDNGIWMGGSYNIIEFCSFYENRDTGLQLAGGAAHNQIINCDSYYNCDSDMGDADGFAPKMDVGTGNYFYGCRAWQNSDDDYDGYLRGTDDVTTTYENCWAFKAGYLKNGSASTGNGNGFKMGGSDDKTLMHNVVLINCLAFSNRVKGFDQNSDKGSMTLYNCTGWNNGTYNFSLPTALNTGRMATLTNCVSLGSSGQSLNAAVVQVTNSWQSPFVATNADFVSVDPSAAYGPRNADGSLPDIDFMQLAAGSDLIDGGTDVGLPYNGISPDLGCFEFADTGDDETPPTPNPMTWAIEPYATGSASITMVASTASDENGVEYYFECVADGGHDSGWQTSPTYTDTGLAPLTLCTYTVTARDRSTNQNATAPSEERSARTLIADVAPPSPDPMAWDLYPYALDASSITMTASTASDESGVEYYFECVSGGGHDSGWQAGVVYTDTGLSPNTTYQYAVRARDMSSNQNMTGWSATKSATTCATGATIEYQAEYQTWYLAATETTNTGYTGPSYVNTNNVVGSWVEWTIPATVAGSHTIAIRFANGTTTNRPMSIAVNGVTVIASFDFPGTGGWTLWTISSTSVSLNLGENTIRLTSLTSNGGPNLDRMDVTGPAIDATPPTPSPMEWRILPAAVSSNSVSMTAMKAGDASGVEYFFANLTDPNHDSGWQDANTYIDSGLVNNTQYTYAVIARDKSVNQNETGWSQEASATTMRYDCAGPIVADLDADCQVDFRDYAVLANAWAGGLPEVDLNSDTLLDWLDILKFADGWLTCGRVPADECWN